MTKIRISHFQTQLLHARLGNKLFTFQPFSVWAVTVSGTDVCAFCCLTGVQCTPTVVRAYLRAWKPVLQLCTPPQTGPRVVGTVAAAVAGHQTWTVSEEVATPAWPPVMVLVPCCFRGPSYRCRLRYRQPRGNYRTPSLPATTRSDVPGKLLARPTCCRRRGRIAARIAARRHGGRTGGAVATPARVAPVRTTALRHHVTTTERFTINRIS